MTNQVLTVYDRLPNVQNVVAGGTATVEIPIGYTYDELKIVYSNSGTGALQTVASIKSDITDIRLKINGKTQREHSAPELLTVNSFHGMGEDDGQIPMFFYEPWRNNKLEAYALAMGTADLTNRNAIQVEIVIDAAATNPKLEVFGLRRQDGRVMGQIAKWRRSTVQVAGTGVNNTFPNKVDSIAAIHAFSANITDFDVKIDGRSMYDEITPANLNNLLENEGLVPQTNVVHIKFDRDLTLDNRLIMEAMETDELGLLVAKREVVKEFQVDYDMAVATNFTAISEIIGFRD